MGLHAFVNAPRHNLDGHLGPRRSTDVPAHIADHWSLELRQEICKAAVLLLARTAKGRIKLVATKSFSLTTSEAVDGYLKAILELGGSEESRVTSNALAERLGVRAASVTGMLQKLAVQRPPLVLYRKHHGAKLTMAGKRRAWELVRHHRLLELFLHDVLKYSWDEVHDEAERLEHFISERLEDRVAALLGDPQIDPHGHLIPQKHQLGLSRREVPLVQWPLNAPATISSVSDHDPAALRQLERLQLMPNATLTIEQKNANASLLIRIAGHKSQTRLSNKLASHVSVWKASHD
jgi:DtxR family Mn-dependent transcriptional regulator